MADTATPQKFKAEMVVDLVDDPDFKLLPYHERNERFVELGKKDAWYRGQPPDVQKAIRAKVFPEDTGIIPSMGALKERASALGQETLEGAQTAGKGAVQGLDAMLGYPAKVVGKAAELYGRIPEAIGTAEPGEQNIFTRTGQALQSFGATKPLETLVTGGQGFTPPTEPGKALAEHVVENAVGAAAASYTLGQVFPLLQKGVPITEQVVNSVWSALKGSTAEELARRADLPPWLQVAANLVASGVSKEQVKDLYTTLKDKVSLRAHVKGLTEKGTEAFGGPSVAQQRLGTAGPTETAQTGALEQLVEGEKAPVTQARQATEQATATRELAQTQQRAATAQNVQDLRAANATHAQQVAQAQQQMYQAQDAAKTAQRGTEDAARQARYAAEDNFRVQIQAAEDTRLSAMEQVRRTNTELAGQLQAQQRRLDEAKVQIAKDNEDALKWAEANAKRTTPEMAGAGRQAPGVGRSMIYGAGISGQNFTEAAYQRFKTVFGDMYDQLWKDHPGVVGDPAKLEASIQTFDSRMKQAARESYIPDPVLGNIEQLVSSAKTPGALNLQEMHAMRSMVLEELRHTPAGSSRVPVLKQVLGMVNQFVKKVGEDYPEAMEKMQQVDTAYRTQGRQFFTGPGAAILKVNPITGEPMKSPVEVGHMLFAPGPSLQGVQGEQNLQAFTTYMNDARLAQRKALLEDDHALASMAEATIDGVVDVARAKFYAATMASGTYDVKAAEKWLQTYDAQIKASPELTKIFRTPRDRTEAIREVEAGGHQLLADEEDYVRQLQLAKQETGAQGGEALARARQQALAERQAATGERTQATRDITQQATQEGYMTQDQLTQAARARAAEVRRAALEKQQAQYQAKDVRDVYSERVRVAREGEQTAKEAEAQATATYNTHFGGVQAAKAALDDAQAVTTLGTRPLDIVAEIERLPREAQNRAYGYWVRQAAGDETTQRAILAAKWQNFIGEKTVDPGKARDFIDKNKPFLRAYYPEYLKDIEVVQRGFEKAAALEVHPTIWNFVRHGGIPGAAFLAAQLLGAGHWKAVGIGAAASGIEQLHRVRQVAALQEIYMDPRNAALIANAIRTQNPALISSAANSILARTGVLVDTLEGKAPAPPTQTP